MEVGDRVLAVGSPFGLTGSVTQGIVSGKSRNLNLNLYEDFLQTDAAMNPGNSGGPLVNMEGKVIGLTSAIKTRSGGFQGVGLAVSSNLAKSIAAQLVKTGVVRRPYIGVSVIDLDEAGREEAEGEPGAGVVVSEVVAKSPGEKANIGVRDVITKVNGVAVRTAREMQRAILALPVGQEVDVVVMRDGKLFLTKVSAEEQAEHTSLKPVQVPAIAAVDYGSLGLKVTDLTADAAERAGLPKEVKGVVVAEVRANSPAARAGLARGQVILQVDKTPVASAEAFRSVIEQAAEERARCCTSSSPTATWTSSSSRRGERPRRTRCTSSSLSFQSNSRLIRARPRSPSSCPQLGFGRQLSQASREVLDIAALERRVHRCRRAPVPPGRRPGRRRSACRSPTPRAAPARTSPIRDGRANTSMPAKKSRFCCVA